MQLHSGLKDKRDILPIVSSEQSISLFFLDNAEIKSMILDRDFSKIDEYKVTRPQVAFKTLLGHSISGNEYNLFFSNNKKNQFYAQTINIAEKENRSKILDLKLKKEKYLEAVTYRDNFLLFTIKKLSSMLKIYEFEGSELIVEKELDLSKHKFSTSSYPDLYSVLSKSSTPFQQYLSTTKIDSNTPIPLELAADKSKLYLADGKVFITIDNSRSNTKILTIDLNSYRPSFELITHEDLECGEALYVVSNSFLVDNILYQVKSCKEALSLRATAIDSKKEIAGYTVTKNQEIEFKNGPIRQEGGTTFYTQGTDKSLSKTKQLLRKMSNSKIGVSAYKVDDKITLTIGGYKEVQQASGGGMTYTPGTNFSTPYGSVSTPATYSYNPTMYGYKNYKNTRAVYFKSVLSAENLAHIDIALPQTAYDKIKKFDDSAPNSTTNETLFKVADVYIFGYYNKSKKTYSLRQFSDEN